MRERVVEPIFSKGGTDEGCLLLHGFAGAPSDMESVGLGLRDAGYTVLCPVIAGHNCLATMEAAGYKEWRESALASLAELRQHAKHTYIIGHSLGGLLGYDLAASEQVSAVVSINSPVKLVARQEIKAQLLKMVRSGASMGSDAMADRVPMSCLSSLYDYTARVLALLPRVSVPALIVQASDDEAIDPADAKTILEELGSSSKRIVWVDGAGYRSILDEKLPQAMQEIIEFLKRVSPKADLEQETGV